MKYAFEYLTDSFSLLNNPIDDYVAMVIIGLIAYVIAYNLVGKLYSNNLIDGRRAGHILHWIIRLVVFVVTFYVAATVIRLYNWFHSLPDYKWFITGISVGTVIIGFIVIKFFVRKKECSKE